MNAKARTFRFVSSYPTYSLILVFALTISILMFLLFYVWDTYRNYRDTQEYFHLTELTGNISNLDDMLTMAAKMAVSSGDLKWENRYRNYEIELDNAIDEAVVVEAKLSIGKSMSKVDESNRKLCEITNRAFKLIHAGQLDAASYLLNNEEYESHKKRYRNGVDCRCNLFNSVPVFLLVGLVFFII